MKWLAECSAAALGEALEAVAPELSGYAIPVPEPAGEGDPQYHKSSVLVGDLDHGARQLASFLAALHQPATRERAEAAVGPLTGAEIPPATTGVLREWFGTRVAPEQHRLVTRWCDWADAVLASPAPGTRAVLVHGDPRRAAADRHHAPLSASLRPQAVS